MKAHSYFLQRPINGDVSNVRSEHHLFVVGCFCAIQIILSGAIFSSILLPAVPAYISPTTIGGCLFAQFWTNLATKLTWHLIAFIHHLDLQRPNYNAQGAKIANN
jgi:hypothetical protein